MKRRCRDCTWCQVRKGCGYPAALARAHAAAIVMDKYSVCHHTNCDGFIEKKVVADGSRNTFPPVAPIEAEVRRQTAQ